MHVQSSKHEYLNTYGKFTFPLSQRAKFLKCFLIKERAKNILEDKWNRQVGAAEENNTTELSVSILSDNIWKPQEVCSKKG